MFGIIINSVVDESSIGFPCWFICDTIIVGVDEMLSFGVWFHLCKVSREATIAVEFIWKPDNIVLEFVETNFNHFRHCVTGAVKSIALWEFSHSRGSTGNNSVNLANFNLNLSLIRNLVYMCSIIVYVCEINLTISLILSFDIIIEVVMSEVIVFFCILWLHQWTLPIDHIC